MEQRRQEIPDSDHCSFHTVPWRAAHFIASSVNLALPVSNFQARQSIADAHRRIEPGFESHRIPCEAAPRLPPLYLRTRFVSSGYAPSPSVHDFQKRVLPTDISDNNVETPTPLARGSLTELFVVCWGNAESCYRTFRQTAACRMGA
jgi:hypothetical protein